MDVNKLFPLKAINKLEENKNKKILIILGEPGLLKSEIIRRFIENKPFILNFVFLPEDKEKEHFVVRIGTHLNIGELDRIENIYTAILDFFKDEKNKGYVIFEKVENILGFPSFDILKQLIELSNPYIHFILESGEDFDISFNGEAVKLKREDFLITPEDIEKFAKSEGLKIPSQVLKNIVERTKGFGFFTRIFLSYYLDTRRLPESGDIPVVERIFREKLDREEPKIKSLILGLSCLNDFTPSELESILGIEKGEDLIKYLSKRYVFIESVGDRYTLYPLFREFIEKELHRHPKGVLIRKWILDNAVDYYIEKEDLVRALRYLVKIGYHSKALDLIFKKIFEVMEGVKAIEIEPIIKKLPEEIKENSPLYKVFTAGLCLRKNDFFGIYNILKDLNVESLESPLKGFYYFFMGISYFFQRKYNESMDMLRKGLETPEAKEEKIRYRLKNLEGALYMAFDNLDKAEEAFKESLEILERIKVARSSYVTVLSNLSLVYSRKGMFREAEEVLLKSIEESVDYFNKLWGFIKLGAYYIEIVDFDRAKKTLEQAYELTKKTNNLYLLVYVYLLYSQIGLYKREFEECKGYIEKAEQFLSNIKDPEIVFFYKILQVKKHLFLREIEKASKIFNTLNVPERKGNIADTETIRALFYFIEGEYHKACSSINKALSFFPTDSYQRKEILLYLFAIQYKTGEFEKAKSTLREILDVPEQDIILKKLKLFSSFYPFEIPAHEIEKFVNSFLSLK